MSWHSLPDEVKLEILRYLTAEELLEIMFVDRKTTRLAAIAWREKMSLQTGGDSQGHFLSLDAVRWALSSNHTFRILAQLPSFVPSEVTRGRKIGKGGTNSVYLVNEHEGLLMKDAGASRGGFSREYNAMVKMESMGLRTVLRDLRFTGRKLQIIMDRINGVVDSKTIIGYKKHLEDYVNPNLITPCPLSKDALSIRAETLNQLLSAWDLMFKNRRYFNDFQFLIDSRGEVYMNDPTDVANDKFWDRGTNTIIQAIINTYEYCHRIGGDKDWRAFKQYKQLIAAQRHAEFKQGWTSPIEFYTPHYTVINYRFCWYQEPSPSTMFRSQAAVDVPNFYRVSLDGGMFGYFHRSCVIQRATVYEWDKWNDLLSLI